jgi:hypothetical protein
MIEKFFRHRQALVWATSTPAGPFLEGLVIALAGQGFGRWKLRQRIQGAAHFSAWSMDRGVAIADLHEDALAAFHRHLPSCTCPGRPPRDGGRPSAHPGRLAEPSMVAGARALIAHLRQLSVVKSPAPTPSPPDLPVLLSGFIDWMRLHRCLQDSTLRTYGRTIQALLAALGDDPSLYNNPHRG